MKNNIKISVVISAFNEEHKIKDCLESVKWADEIIFIDSGSTDKTLEIAKNYTSKIYKRPNNLMLNVNKNYGFTKATGDWILCLDADERVTPQLQSDIQLAIEQSNNETIHGYWIPRKNIIFGKWIQHTGWYPDYQLRLFKKDKGKFEEKHVHEMIKLDGETKKLSEHIMHYNYDSINHFIQKMTIIYAPNEAEQLLKNGYKFQWQDVVRMPIKEFLSRFFAQEGYKDGLHGLVLSLFMAFYHLVIFGYLWEKEKFVNVENVLEGTEYEFDKVRHDSLFWYKNEKLKTINNLFKKTFYRLLRKT